MGRTLYGDRGDPTKHLPTEGRQRQRSLQHIEHRTVTSFLPLKLGLTIFFHSTFAPTKHPSPSTLGLGRSEAPRGCDTNLLFYYHILILFAQTKGHSVPLITLRNWRFQPPDRSYPATTYGYEQLSLTGHAQVLKVAAYGSMGRCEKERTKNKATQG